ncbi:MAG TPA: peptidase M16, partial [Prevotella sp.]|nr:peptidase M16 [Prevotella sp.]
MKGRRDTKMNQNSNFRALVHYGEYGEYNSFRNIPDSTELATAAPQKIVDLAKSLNGYKHEVLYYGPLSMKDAVAAIDKCHKPAKKLMDVPVGKPYTTQLTPKNEIWVAPYKA